MVVQRLREEYEEGGFYLTGKGLLRMLTVDLCWKEPRSWWTHLQVTVAMGVSEVCKWGTGCL